MARNISTRLLSDALIEIREKNITDDAEALRLISDRLGLRVSDEQIADIIARFENGQPDQPDKLDYNPIIAASLKD